MQAVADAYHPQLDCGHSMSRRTRVRFSALSARHPSNQTRATAGGDGGELSGVPDKENHLSPAMFPIATSGHTCTPLIKNSGLFEKVSSLTS